MRAVGLIFLIAVLSGCQWDITTQGEKLEIQDLAGRYRGKCTIPYYHELNQRYPFQCDLYDDSVCILSIFEDEHAVKDWYGRIEDIRVDTIRNQFGDPTGQYSHQFSVKLIKGGLISLQPIDHWSVYPGYWDELFIPDSMWHKGDRVRYYFPKERNGGYPVDSVLEFDFSTEGGIHLSFLSPSSYRESLEAVYGKLENY